MAGRLRICIILVEAVLVLVATSVAAQQTAVSTAGEAAAYQEELVRKTSGLHPTQHSFNGYSGPWLENVFIDRWLSLKPSTSRLFIPVAWTDAMHFNTLRMHMQQVLNHLSPRFKYFTVVQAGRGFNHPMLNLRVPSNIDILFFMAGGDTPTLRTVPVPLLKEDLHPLGLAKSISVSSQSDVRNHEIRRALQAQYNSSYLFLSQSEDWKVITESSNFSFCPRGYGPTSFRLYETLQLGTIPIYVWEEEKWLPFEDLIDWNEIAIIVESRDIDSIAAKIAEADLPRMQAALAKHSHMFTYDFTVQYILKRLGEENSDEPIQKPVQDLPLTIVKPAGKRPLTAAQPAGKLRLQKGERRGSTSFV